VWAADGPPGLPANTATDPDKALFVYADVHNFIRVFGLLRDGGDTLEILQKEYLDKGTPGLKMFIEKYDLTVERLLKAIRKYPEKYASLDEMPPLLLELERANREAFVKVKELIPQAVFPPTYFLVESRRGIGSGSKEGQLIAVDKWKHPVDNKVTMIVHELIHFQQVMAVGYDKYIAMFGPEKNLLGLCIREGTAEFFALKITGRITQHKALDYIDENGDRLWDLFVTDMNGSETGDWMWRKPEDSLQPPHVGYALGCRIVEAFYERADDKAQAVADILSVTDYPVFLERSGYAAQFAN
jgi:hypothetical protein